MSNETSNNEFDENEVENITEILELRKQYLEMITDKFWLDYAPSKIRLELNARDEKLCREVWESMVKTLRIYIPGQLSLSTFARMLKNKSEFMVYITDTWDYMYIHKPVKRIIAKTDVLLPIIKDAFMEPFKKLRF
jgi:hypothetical protein